VGTSRERSLVFRSIISGIGVKMSPKIFSKSVNSPQNFETLLISSKKSLVLISPVS
jgi:hypothetical protein